jgi:hypothetical protein
MGRHEPPTNRSFYLSVAASTLRFAIIVALVVSGVVVINRAFPDTTSGGTGTLPDGGDTEVTESPSESPTESPTEQPTQSPTIAGTVIVVMNAAGVEGLAGDTTTELVERYDYEALEPGTAPALSVTTTIYYRAKKDRVEAEFLANDFFSRIEDTVRIAKLPAGQTVDETAQLAIFIGTDYAQVA